MRLELLASSIWRLSGVEASVCLVTQGLSVADVTGGKVTKKE